MLNKESMIINGLEVLGDEQHALDTWHRIFKLHVAEAKEGFYNKNNYFGVVKSFKELISFMEERGYNISYPEIFEKIHGSGLS